MHLGFEQNIPVYSPTHDSLVSRDMRSGPYILLSQSSTIRDVLREAFSPFTDEVEKSRTVIQGYLHDDVRVFNKSVSIRRSNYPERIAETLALAAQTVLSHFGANSDSINPGNVVPLMPRSTQLEP